MATTKTQFIFGAPQYTGNYGDWTAPSLRGDVETASLVGGMTQEVLPNVDSTSKARSKHVQTLMNASGSVTSSLYPSGWLERVMRSLFTNNDVTALATGYTNDMLPDDSVTQLPWFSTQLVYDSDTARSGRGVVVSKISINVGAGAVGKFTTDLIVQDIAMRDATKIGKWSDGVTDAPAVITGATLVGDGLRPYVFSNAQILTGDGVTKTGNKLSITNPVVRCEIESFSLDIDVAAEGRPAVCQGPPTIKRTLTSTRMATLSFDNTWITPNLDYWEAMQTGEVFYVQVSFISPDFIFGTTPYSMTITFPYMIIDSEGDGTPDLDGTKSIKTQSVTMTSFENPDVGTDIQVSIDSLYDLG
ncbi:MAG: hypothetical protein GY928_34035 [Colwellia sp.]|nr:hypothetical protein [Colwellia sp.]